MERRFVERLEGRCLFAFTAPVDPRVVSNLDAAWKFIRSDAAGAQAITYNDTSWSGVSIPHTWNAADGQDGGDNYYRGIGWYRKHIAPPAADAGKSLYLKFDGANLVTDLYINGAFVGEHKGGYSAFGWDVSSYLSVNTDNVVAVKVSNAPDANVPPLGGDYTQFGGIYRHVNLIATSPQHIALQEFVPADNSANPAGPSAGYWLNTPGVYVTPTNVTSASANLKLSASIRNDAAVSRNLTVVSDVVDAGGNLINHLSSAQNVAAGANVSFVQNTVISNPHLWNGVSDPYLCNVYVSVIDGGATTDVVKQSIGFRSFRADASQGALLNGQPYDLHGVNFHQDRLNEGWAISDADQTQDVNLIKDIGATFIRLSHYQHPQLTYNLLDQTGIAAWSEIPVNGTNNAGVTNSTAFLDSAEQQLQEMIRQNYNHPAILVWGLYNELPDNATTQSIISKLNALAHLEDPTRPTTAASIVGDNAALNYTTDLVAFNKYSGWYGGVTTDLGSWLDQFHSSRPNTPVGLGEYGAGASIFQHQYNPPTPTPGGSFHPEEYQDLFHESYWKQLKARPYTWAKLIWNMFDFAADGRNEGDSPGRNDKGLITYDRATKKDAFYFYKANWSADPVLYITSRRFTARTNATTDVKVYSNLDNVTLVLNGVNLGTLSSAANPDRIFTWSNVQLAGGSNLVQVTGTKNGQTYTDSVTWTLNGVPPPNPQTPFKGVPFSIGAGASTTIQNEDFDNGGESVAYHDIETNNNGGAYRNTGVDLQPVTGDSGAYNVGWTLAGEWLEYSIDVADPGSYDLGFRVASIGDNGKFHVEIDGVNVTGVMTIPNTGGWQNWTTITRTGLSLTKGPHVLRLAMDATGSAGGTGNFNDMTVSPAAGAAQTPFKGVPFTIGSGAATIEVEDFDNGGEGVAFHDVDAANSGGAYRTTGVDLQPVSNDGGAYNLGWTLPGEWLEYSINVVETGTYDLSLRVASPGAGGKFHLEVDGSDVTGQIALPNTGGWQSWTNVTRNAVNLSSGNHVLRLAMDAAGSTGWVGNFNSITIAKAPTTPPPPGTQSPFKGTPFAISKSAAALIEAEDFDEGGEGVAYHDLDAANIPGKYRSTGVDIETSADAGGGFNIGYARAGEWLEYTAHVVDDGSYNIDFRVASAASGGQWHLEVDGADVTGSLAMLDTGGWQVWKTTTRTGVNLPAGQHVIRLVMDLNGASGYVGNFNSMKIISAA